MAFIYNYDQLHPRVQSLLMTLIQRAETPERQRVARIRLSVQTHAWYFSRDEPGLRGRVHEELKWLALQGWIVLRWQKYEVDNELASIDLLADEQGPPVEFYQFCRREPRQRQTEQLRQLLLSQKPRAAWIGVFIQDILARLTSSRSLAPLSLNSPETNRDLLMALNAIAGLSEPTLERTLSVRLFGESKRLEGLRPQIVSVLRAYSPSHSAADQDEWEMLRAHHVHRPPIFTSLAGPLILCLPSSPSSSASLTAPSEGEAQYRLDLGACPSGLGLPDDILRTACPQSHTLQAVLTVENQTSYTDLLLVRPQALLLVFCNGFPQLALIHFLRRLRAAYPALPFWHWGDLDAGGLDILRHLRSQLGSIRPCAMDQQTWERYAS
ncbi:MAG TPA: Wadjet anti-phage system protein JetD domain-containing protein, partial [Ktedonobacteraceae bacterium]|nr:Wadjet anti-phage system protein JetD domain-containing protein [Ktedonobacteraceae bacterium]